ncbi:MAG: DUF1573 domain-containing protein [bacterium]|nr:DUF1573 domain-containing protein [bacterium]
MPIKNIIIYILTVVAIVGGVIWMARPDKNNNTDPTASIISVLNFSETQYDFGTISMANGNVSKIFKITNSSNKSIEIEKIYTSCMCTEAELNINNKKLGPFGMPGHNLVPKVNQTLNVGETAEIKVIYNPNAHGPAGVGPVDRIVYVEEKGRQPLEFRIKAVVTP